MGATLNANTIIEVTITLMTVYLLTTFDGEIYSNIVASVVVPVNILWIKTYYRIVQNYLK